ncbi:MAG TPA: hypothetical protein VGI10_09790 [Polyangiaceae bacterium]|jgi:hypothetical protein
MAMRAEIRLSLILALLRAGACSAPANVTAQKPFFPDFDVFWLF